MRDSEFRDWLAQRNWNGSPLTKTARGTRLSWLRALERALPNLGFAEGGLDEVHASGGSHLLLDRLRGLYNDWNSNASAARKLAPEAENPRGQIGNVLAAARLYSHFAEGRDPNYDFRAESGGDRFAAGIAKMRETFLHRMYDFEDMSREEGEFWDTEKSYKYAARGEVVALSARSDLTEEERGKAIYDRLCQSTIQGLPLSWRTRAELGKAPSEIRSRFYRVVAGLASEQRPAGDLAEWGARALEQLRAEGFAALRRGEVLNIVLSILGSVRPDECCWFKISIFDKGAMLLLGKRLFPSATFVRAEFDEFQALLLRVRDVLEEWEWQPESLEDVQGFFWVALDEHWDTDWGAFPDPEDVDAAMAQHDELGPEGFGSKFPGFGTPTQFWVLGKGQHAGNIYPSKPIAAVAMGWPSINGGWSRPDSACSLLHRAGYRIVDAEGRPVPVPNKPYLQPNAEPEVDSPAMTPRTPTPTNLILYGPPGTGKTYRTAEEAVHLIDGTIPVGREAVRSRYDQLVDAGQIRLVTFHQNYSYEDFVEGLRPVTGSDSGGGEDQPGTGFRLEARRGIFREICAVAEEARKNAGRRGGFELAGRRVFKMSLGRAGLEDHIFHAAIEGNYIVLGWGGDVDWSPPQFDQWSAILERWRDEMPGATGSDPNVVQMWPFRSAMKDGDLVIVSEGNSHFRAIAEVTGPYRFEPTDEREYNHRRTVRWLLVPDEPLPVETIYGKNFMMQSCYQLKDSLLKQEALARLLPGAGTTADGVPDQFVLIVDEINRANVSKVFGELITLIEPDKRLGSGPEQLAAKLPYSGDTFGVPDNLHLIGTMNTADRSIALLDTALRRRFLFREVAPQPELLDEEVEGVPLRRVLETINERIEYLIDRDHRIGHAFFMGEGGSSRAAIDATMRDRVLPLLQEYFFEDWSRVAAVLGEPRGRGGFFLDCSKLKDPTGTDGEPRLSWRVREAFAEDAYRRLVGPLPESDGEAADDFA
ncbi:MAG: 5-methylcytosine-specific restriction enzyme [Sphingomonadales bacterium]|jgi:5-methylcytosine-specific restriction protein B|nr:5-methylcytosine-specific restriction enzyme [Sphingomonadales bacterium]